MAVPLAWAPALLELSMESNAANFWRLTCDLLHRVAPHRLAVVSTNLLVVRDETGAVLPSSTNDFGNERLSSVSLHQQLGLKSYNSPLAYIDPAALRKTTQGADPLVLSHGCDRAYTLAFLFESDPRYIHATIALYRRTEDAAQEAAHRLQLERLLPLLHPLVTRLMDELQHASFLAGVGDFLHSLPVGLVFVSWHHHVVFVNDEGYRQTHRWKTAPDTRVVKDPKELFSIPDDLYPALYELKTAWIHSAEQLLPMSRTSVTVTHARVPALKATVSIVLDSMHPLTTPNFVIRYAGLGGTATDAAFEPSEVQLSALSQLTPAERSVAVLVMQGLDNQAIAAKLHREVSTVKDHLTRVYAKLGLRSRAQLASLAQMR